MPPRSLFDNSHRPDKLVMPACLECNKGTSTADLAVAMVSRWAYDSTPQEQVDHRKLAQQVKKQAPELVAEWTKLDTGQTANARRHLIGYGVQVPQDAAIASIGPVTLRQLNLFAHKAVLALYFEHFRKPLLNTGRVWATWRTKEDFAKKGVPPSLLDMLPEYGTLMQGKWDERETFEYRHARNVEEGLFACLARFRRGLFITGFAAADANTVASNALEDWVVPSELLGSIDAPRFRKRL